ncbi:uncharacterized [Tachysurus ichikawai]
MLNSTGTEIFKQTVSITEVNGISLEEAFAILNHPRSRMIQPVQREKPDWAPPSPRGASDCTLISSIPPL